MISPYIIGINGSPFRDGTTVKLLNAVLNGAKNAGAKTEILHLYELDIKPTPGNYSVSPKLETIKKMPKDGMQKIYKKLLKAEALVFATPTYWANMSGMMKTFIDRLTPLENDGFKLEGKLAAFIAVSKEGEGGAEMAAMSMVAALLQMGVMIPSNAVLWYPGKWVRADGVDESWAFSDAPKVGKAMVKLSKLLKKLN